MILHIRMITMDSIYYGSPYVMANLCPSRANIIVQMDGGLRRGDCAAAAFVIGLWSQTSQYEPWFVQGTFLHSSFTALASEASALDQASEKLK